MRIVLTAVLATFLSSGCIDPVDEPDVGADQQSVSAAGPPGATSDRMIPRRGFWRYDDRGVDLGTGWRTGSFAGSFGTGPFGYGESYLTTTTSFGADPNHKRPTTYFRGSFFARSTVRKMFLRVMYDDGFVFYINGKEGGRAGMPAGPVSYSTLALGHEAENQYVTFDISSQIANVKLNAANDLAIEVHQANASSSDLVFDAELIVWDDFDTTDFYSEAGIQKGAWWRFSDTGADFGAMWRPAGYDDDAWSSGEAPLGFGEQAILTDTRPGPITTYLRTDFTAHGVVQALSADVMYDDGFVAYLNGTEIGRASMPAGTPNIETRAGDHEANGYQHFEWGNVAPLIDHDGLNTLAVEVHQATPTSSDLVFDLALSPIGAWRAQRSGTTEALSSVWFTDAQHGWVVGGHGTARRTSDGGATWTAFSVPTTANLTAVTFADATHGWIAGADGTILRTTDGGATWTAGTVAAQPTSMSCPDAQTCELAAGHPYRSTDGGASWTVQDTGEGGFGSITFADPMHGWVAGSVPSDDGGDSWAAIYATSDGGVTWTRQWVSGFHFYYLFDIEAIDASTVWAVGESSLSTDGENKLVTHDGGATWTGAPATSNGLGLLAIDFGDADHGCAVGWYGGIVCTDDGGDTWRVSQERLFQQAPSFADVHFVDAQTGWAVGDSGTIWKTTSGGL